jgi:hypothetical protein
VARPRGSLLRALLALPLAVLAAAPLAEAQGGCTLVLAFNPAGQEQQPGEARTYNVTLDAGATGGTVNLQIVQVSPGWNASFQAGGATTSATMAPAAAGGTPTSVGLVVRAPSSAEGRVGQVTVTGTLSCGPVAGVPLAGTDTKSATLSPTLAAPPPSPTHGESPSITPVLFVIAAALLLAGAGAAIYVVRPHGLAVRAPEPRREMPPGGGASFPIHVANRSKERIAAQVRFVGVPEGWKIVSPPGDLALDPGRDTTLQVLLRAPPDAAPGSSAEIEVELLEHGSGRLRRVGIEGAIAGPERPDVVVRDEGAGA